MQDQAKNTSMKAGDTGVKQKKQFTFPPQDGYDVPYTCEADTIEEGERAFKAHVKSKK